MAVEIPELGKKTFTSSCIIFATRFQFVDCCCRPAKCCVSELRIGSDNDTFHWMAILRRSSSQTRGVAPEPVAGLGQGSELSRLSVARTALSLLSINEQPPT